MGLNMRGIFILNGNSGDRGFAVNAMILSRRVKTTAREKYADSFGFDCYRVALIRQSEVE